MGLFDWLTPLYTPIGYTNAYMMVKIWEKLKEVLEGKDNG